ncbi:MAG: AAA family ATPase, partial [Patescibacteria group bacterium]
MMLVLCGLHGSGKSHLTARLVSDFGWQMCVKRDLLRQLHATGSADDDWIAWYRALYASEGAYEVTKRLLALVPSSDRLILDSVHNLTEWRAIRDLHPDAVLASVIAPKAVRTARNGPEDLGL